MLTLKDPSLLKQKAFIDGAWCDADDAATIDVFNPATGALIGTVPKMGAAETKRAIEAANAAWPAWRARTCCSLKPDGACAATWVWPRKSESPNL